MPEATAAGKEVGQFGGAVGQAAELLHKFNPAVLGATIGVGALVNAFDNAVRRYSEVSPEVAQAQAMVEVRQVMNDIRRGQEHGRDLARFVEAQGRMQEKFEEAKMKFITKITPIVEAIFELLGFVMDGIGAIPQIADQLASPLSSIAEHVGESVAMQRDSRYEKNVDDPTTVLFKGGEEGIQVPEA